MDVVVHLAFVIMGARRREPRVNVQGSRNVFEATVTRAARSVWSTRSSVAAYGFPQTTAASSITEDTPARGTDRFPYSAQKAEVEAVARRRAHRRRHRRLGLPPVHRRGPGGAAADRQHPLRALGQRMPASIRSLFDEAPMLKPVLPDPGVPFQLVHHDDVATAMRAGVLGRGEPGAYNLAATGELTMADLADALGYYSVPMPSSPSTPRRSSSPARRSCPTRRRGSRRSAARC